jgi:hypothetical protein
MTDLPSDNPTSSTTNVGTSSGHSDQKKPTPSGISAPIGKERADGKPASAESSGEARQEVTPITEYTRQVDLEPEVEGWLEKVEREDSQLQQPVTDPSSPGSSGQALLDNVQPSNFKVVLPMTQDEVNKGLHHKVLDSVRWLAEWCTRMIKMFGNKVAYRRK